MVGSAILRMKNNEFEWITASRDELNLKNSNDVTQFLLRNTVEGVILAAAKVGGISVNAKYQYDFLRENLLLQLGVIQAAVDAGVKNFIFLGSSCVYPKFAAQPILENEILTGSLEPSNEAYAIAKIAGIKLCESISKEKFLNYMTLMPSNLYGPNDNYENDVSHVPAALIRRFHEAKLWKQPEVVVWGSGLPRREFMHVDDLADACAHFIKSPHPGEIINIGTGNDISILDFAYLVANIVGYTGRISFDTSKIDGTPKKLLNVKKAENFGWQANIELSVGLAETYSWFSKAYEKGEIRGY